MRVRIAGHIIALLLAMLVNDAAGSQADSVNRKYSVLPVPAIGYSPETRTYLGAVVLLTMNPADTLARASKAELEFNATWNRQFITEMAWDYMLNEDNWLTRGMIHFSKYPDFYYGIGNNTRASDELLYGSNRFILDAGVLRKIGNRLYAGLDARFIDYNRLSHNGIDGSFPELIENSTAGIGLSVLKDSRNSILTPLNGIYIHGSLSYNFSETDDYGRTSLDLRYYRTIFGRLSLAGRFYNEFTSGHPPFYDYPAMGGDRYVRGYLYGRYRDKHLSTIQAEARVPVVWRFGIAFFGGYSNVYPGPGALKLDEFRYNLGIGLRFLVDRKNNINLRIDYAVGTGNNSGFYIAFGESF